MDNRTTHFSDQITEIKQDRTLAGRVCFIPVIPVLVQQEGPGLRVGVWGLHFFMFAFDSPFLEAEAVPVMFALNAAMFLFARYK